VLALAANDEPPDLILLDVVMPGFDGYETCRRLKQQEPTREIPVIFVTSLGHEDGEMRGLELGAVDYITKPVNLRIMRARIHTHLKLKQIQDHLAALSNVDGLTGIANRRRFDEVLALEWRRNLRAETPLALVIADIDFFKQFNDSHGHLAGDDCLRRVAAAIDRSMRRPTDLAARYGGEEFVALLADTDTEGACLVAEAMRANVAALEITNGDATPLRVTVSCGVASAIPTSEDAAVDLVTQADTRLYAAKSSGRNRIAC